jgi:16S rRNA (uracil1498-N3)-methyltransferase
MSLRLFINQPFVADAPLSINAQHSHYLTRVMRCRTKDIVHIFNGKQGLWTGILSDPFHIVPAHKIMDQSSPTHTIALAFSPIKQQNWLIEKATEMGVTDFYPIICHRTVVRHFSEKRHTKIIYEACEQSHRLHIPILHPPQTLDRFLQIHRDLKMPWTVLDPLSTDPLKPCAHGMGLCIGPEGGWSLQEIESFKKHAWIRWAHLGSTILRAETAAVAALAIAQSKGLKT